MRRRSFLKTSTLATIGVGIVPGMLSGEQIDIRPDAVRVDNGEPQELLKNALEALGGLEQFISMGDKVVIKPNIGWARAPKFAANTNPDLVAEIVALCFNAGAEEVKIFDRTCNDPRRCYSVSEIEDKATEKGADVIQMRKNRFSPIEIKHGKVLKEWEIYKDYLQADKVINVPIAKHHSLSRVSLGIKNLMGVMGGNRGLIHTGFDQKLADICSEILPTLTIIDAYRILINNGPTGGNPEDVKLQKSIIISDCVVAADYLALDFFSIPIHQVGHVQEMANRQMNKYDLNSLNYINIAL